MRSISYTKIRKFGLCANHIILHYRKVVNKVRCVKSLPMPNSCLTIASSYDMMSLKSIREKAQP